MLTRSQMEMEMRKTGLTSRYEVSTRVACSRVNLASHAGNAAANESSQRGGRLRPPIPEPSSKSLSISRIAVRISHPQPLGGTRGSASVIHPGTTSTLANEWVGRERRVGSGMGDVMFWDPGCE